MAYFISNQRADAGFVVAAAARAHRNRDKSGIRHFVTGSFQIGNSHRRFNSDESRDREFTVISTDSARNPKMI
jgi:hypothetical protein